MKKVYFFLAALGLLYKPAGAQVTVTYASGQQLFNKLAGNGIQLVPGSISTHGLPTQAGLFTCPNKAIGLSDGIILSTGDIKTMESKNDKSSAGESFEGKGSYQDADMNVYRANFDASVLEFDFIPTGKKVQFNFVFASEEYDEYVDLDYSDLFGLFISGPNIQGDQWGNGTYKFSRQAKNLATIGNTTISVQSINYHTNTHLYIPNTANNPNMQCDGYTTVLSASADGLVCDGSTKYHLKIVIGDVRDKWFDSWILLKAGSLSSNFQVGSITELGPVCEGDTLQLQLSGSPGTYVWSTGDTAQSTTVIANSSNPSYTVTASNAEGCSITRSTTLNVYTSQNQPPYCTGINGTGKFTYYVQAGRAFCFDLPHGDPQSNEKVRIRIPNNLPIGSSFTFPNNDNEKSNNPLARFCWQPGTNDIGEHCFTDTVIDNNKCRQDTSIYQICIRAYCQGCDSSVYYQMRSQTSGFPLPARTAAAQRIVAGNKVVQGLPQGKVIVSSGEQVHFKAGLEIVLDTGFIAEAGSEFTAEVHEATCTSEADCNFCCRYWTGWDDIHVPNVITPNGDGQNDYFTIGRWSAPGEMGCLPNLTCYELEIFNRWGVRVYQNSYNAANVPSLLNPYQCCYISNLLIPGWHNLNVINWGGNGHDDDFFYVLKLCSGCDGEKTFNGTLKVMGSNELQAPLPGAEEPWQAMAPASLRVVPNPGNGIFELWTTGLAPTEKAELEICNAAGQPVYKQTSYHTGPLQINLGQAPKGIYYLKMNSGQRLFVKKIVIQ